MELTWIFVQTMLHNYLFVFLKAFCILFKYYIKLNTRFCKKFLSKETSYLTLIKINQ